MKKTKRDLMKFETALQLFIQRNVATAGLDWEPPSWNDCEIVIKVNSDGTGYIRLLNQDSDTLDFKDIGG